MSYVSIKLNLHFYCMDYATQNYPTFITLPTDLYICYIDDYKAPVKI